MLCDIIYPDKIRKRGKLMFTDMFGNDRLKVGLHMHTTRSDGKKTIIRTAPPVPLLTNLHR